VIDLRLPPGGGRSEHEDLVRQRARAIRRRLTSLGLGRIVQDDDVMTDLICRTSPQAGAGTIGFVADWILWVFPLDDLCEHLFRERAAAEPVSLLTASALPQIVTTGLADLCTDLAARMSAGWTSQFVGDLDSYLRHAIRFAGTTDPGDLPAPAEFLVLRREESAARPTVDLIEVACGADLPERFRGSAGWRRVTDACADVLAWTNDIYSYRKERHAGSRFNLVDVLIEHALLPEPEACAQAVDMTNRMAQQFEAAVSELRGSAAFTSLPEKSRSDALRCVSGMRHWMSGQYEWFATTRPARYQVAQHR
jgi:germacradienol/geosmin synthase